MKQLVNTAKENPVTSFLIGLFTLTGVGGGGLSIFEAVRTYDNLATIQYVDTAVANHVLATERQMADISQELARIRAFTEIVPELEELYKLQCMGTPNLGGAIIQLENRYEDLTGEEYEPKSCERLLAGIN